MAITDFSAIDKQSQTGTEHRQTQRFRVWKSLTGPWDERYIIVKLSVSNSFANNDLFLTSPSCVVCFELIQNRTSKKKCSSYLLDWLSANVRPEALAPPPLKHPLRRGTLSLASSSTWLHSLDVIINTFRSEDKSGVFSLSSSASRYCWRDECGDEGSWFWWWWLVGSCTTTSTSGCSQSGESMAKTGSVQEWVIVSGSYDGDDECEE